ncbi:aspartyl-phosphate phosphatase Spo0E family protein [Bacillus sp. EB600]|uniref:aspartyl-phosphate phosphatase Spo0E family protein n=1 Tax=Bacillus sp. EB600 TaxID=2806345 RepID=UPI00210AD218|nr:aspartyl-phosphate phosphatase Spo0E family protein [Bacillus sp. EB600]MCQ6281738.1 aspartyl-phosphate phosphatase Spo0E family protein [Bacillus sp. EB600]
MRTHKAFTKKETLEYRINHLRNEMIQSAAATGLNSHRTIYYSQELDKLINIYQKHFYHMDRNERIFHNDKIV